MNKLLLVEAVVLAILAVALLSYVSSGSWDLSAQPFATDYNTSFWNLNTTSPPLNVNVTYAGTTSFNNVSLAVYNVWFDSNSTGGSPILIHSLLLEPANSSGLPGVLFLQGAENSTNGLFLVQEAVAARGYVTMLMDSPGSGNSTGPAFTPDNMLNFTEGPYSSYFYQDVMAAYGAVTVLGTMPGVNSSEIGVAGDSEGGLAAIILSSIDSRINAVVPMMVSGYLGENVERGSLFNFLLPSNTSLSDPAFGKLVRYFDPIAYAQNLTVPILMPVGTNDPYFLLTQVNGTFDSVPLPAAAATPSNQTSGTISVKVLNLEPNDAHSISLNWVSSIDLFLDQNLKGSPAVLVTPQVTTAEPSDFYSAINVTVAPLSMTPAQEHSANYSLSVYYRYSIPGYPWSESAVGGATSPNASSTALVALPPLPTNVEYFVALKSNGTIVSTSPVFQVWEVPSSFVIILIFLILVGLVFAINWKEAIGAYMSSDLRGSLFFIIGMALWLIAGFSLALPWVNVPGNASLSALQVWDRFSNQFPGAYIALSLIILALIGYAVRMWIGGIVLIVAGAILLSGILGVFAQLGAVSFALGAYVFGICIVISLLLSAVVRIAQG
jgi:cephalosporin-C deacetylase-like acetyl esterase